MNRIDLDPNLDETDILLQTDIGDAADVLARAADWVALGWRHSEHFVNYEVHNLEADGDSLAYTESAQVDPDTTVREWAEEWVERIDGTDPVPIEEAVAGENTSPSPTPVAKLAGPDRMVVVFDDDVRLILDDGEAACTEHGVLNQAHQLNRERCDHRAPSDVVSNLPSIPVEEVAPVVIGDKQARQTVLSRLWLDYAEEVATAAPSSDSGGI